MDMIKNQANLIKLMKALIRVEFTPNYMAAK